MSDAGVRHTRVPVRMRTTNLLTPSALCPDLLSIRNIGEADGWRGRVVRGFFRVLWIMTGV